MPRAYFLFVLFHCGTVYMLLLCKSTSIYLWDETANRKLLFFHMQHLANLKLEVLNLLQPTCCVCISCIIFIQIELRTRASYIVAPVCKIVFAKMYLQIMHFNTSIKHYAYMHW